MGGLGFNARLEICLFEKELGEQAQLVISESELIKRSVEKLCSNV